MATFRYVVADVFTDVPLAGNQVAVFTDAREIPADMLQPLARVLIERTFDRDLLVDPVDQAFLGLAALAVFRVDAAVGEFDRDPFERELLAVGVEAQRHRRAGAEAREQ